MDLVLTENIDFLTKYFPIDGKSEIEYRFDVLDELIKLSIIKSKIYKDPMFKIYWLKPDSELLKHTRTCGHDLSHVQDSLYRENPHRITKLTLIYILLWKELLKKEFFNYLQKFPVEYQLDIARCYSHSWLLAELLDQGRVQLTEKELETAISILLRKYLREKNEAKVDAILNYAQKLPLNWTNIILPDANQKYFNWLLNRYPRSERVVNGIIEVAIRSRKLSDVVKWFLAAGYTKQQLILSYRESGAILNKIERVINEITNA